MKIKLFNINDKINEIIYIKKYIKIIINMKLNLFFEIDMISSANLKNIP